MKARSRLTIFISAALLACATTALGDGGMFIRHAREVDILQPTQKVYIHWDGFEEKLLIQTRYEGPAEEMVWIVPVPSLPTVEEGDPNVFEQLSIETYYSDLSFTDFAGLRVYVSGRAGEKRRDPVEWRRQIGAYDVALLRPVGEETVIEWLAANEFGVPDKAVPILESYIREGWWMVTAKIHPDSLTDITREKLAQGLLHPLEMTFQSRSCLFPMRLTSIAAGPVEELIYIEGPTHYEPATFADGKWTIDIFGGPVRQVPDGGNLSDVEYTAAIVEGRAETIFRRYLTKLRRVFQPEEMTEDIIFAGIDYAKLLASNVSSRVGEGATQYGRRRDPNGIPALLGVLTPANLDRVKPAPEECQPLPNPSAHILFWRAVDSYASKCAHLRSCIWALGEIAIDHNNVSQVEETLLRCAKHENQLIRMEAYIASIKAGLTGLGPVLRDQLVRILDGDLTYLVSCDWEALVSLAEANILADWIERYGASTDKEMLHTIICQTISRLPTDTTASSGPDAWGNAYLYDWPWWLVYRGIAAPDEAVVASLKTLRAKFPDTNPVILFFLKAEALCGSSDAVPLAARWLGEAQSRVLPGLEGPVKGGYGRLTLPTESGRSLRDLVLRVGTRGDNDSGMFAEINGTILRATLTSYELDDWYRLYLLAQIENPQVPDTEMIRTIWDTGDEGKRLVAVDVLWLWGDAETMRELYDQCDQSKVRWEIGRLVADLERTPHR